MRTALILLGLFLSQAIVTAAGAECSVVLWAQNLADPARWQFMATYPSFKWGAGLALCNDARIRSEREQPGWRWHCAPDTVDPRPRGK